MTIDIINWCLIFVVLLVVVLLYILANIKRVDLLSNDKIVDFPQRSGKILKKNCDTTVVYSLLDEQCNQLCLGSDTFQSINGVCVNTLHYDKQNALANECDAKQGVVAYLIGDTQFGTSRVQCLSIDPGIRPNDIREKNIICANKFNDDGYTSSEINYLESFPQINTCRCELSTQVPIVIANTQSIRQHAVCVDKKSIRLFAHNSLTIKDQHVEPPSSLPQLLL